MWQIDGTTQNSPATPFVWEIGRTTLFEVAGRGIAPVRGSRTNFRGIRGPWPL